ncbi:uncharacterized protein N7496_002937 [Penicillium cataractarum]|uniref:Uncharacterized protein n=1 Tax=Penicillium cataractarum TaxID=2100454 RepID=A0A9W9SNF3_9EURO|nr:uncharacterized protein N7496_002937 [Penicillium cataractarum]KAJ5380509.1 hypothetical protein N7496_002937 [Penicillium cataractarum]
MTTRSKSSSGNRADTRSLGPGFTLAASLNLPPYNPCAWFQKEGLTPAQAALRKSNEDLAHCLAKLKANATRLQREIFLLQRHVKEFQHPLFETWEADILTRLIEVAHAHQPNKMKKGIAIGLGSSANPEMVSLAYINAAKQVQEETLDQLGLSFQHHQAIRRYEEVRKCLFSSHERLQVHGKPEYSDFHFTAPCLHLAQIAAYRSPNPFKTETPFAKWLVEEKNNRPDKYAFWSKLYPICYGRSVEQSSAIF